MLAARASPLTARSSVRSVFGSASLCASQLASSPALCPAEADSTLEAMSTTTLCVFHLLHEEIKLLREEYQALPTSIASPSVVN